MLEWSVNDFLEKTGSSEPTPGGGAVCGLVGALASSLDRMATGFAKEKDESLQNELRAITDELSRLAEADADSFSEVVKAWRMEKENPQREEALKKGYEKALAVPARMLDELVGLSRLQTRVVEATKDALLSDAAIASKLVEAAGTAASYNIRVNVLAKGSGQDAERWIEETARRMAELRKHLSEADAALKKRWKDVGAWRGEVENALV